ncbi:hypothetical protein Atai01_02650 [Amycolatopsis taiwanensis]|uniref:Uncharacterized protein n=1 Tax=Amycolatopsis taiwanensis TaxID=342230 RepID=A0A9W6QW06_9PSEU|nr:hypothetical protein Atai01_02650 [Amycolatopsis taiwanensis]
MAELADSLGRLFVRGKEHDQLLGASVKVTAVTGALGVVLACSSRLLLTRKSLALPGCRVRFVSTPASLAANMQVRPATCET